MDSKKTLPPVEWDSTENMMTLMKEKQNGGRFRAIIGLILRILFLVLCAQMVSGNLAWFCDVPSIILIVGMVLILLFMTGLTGEFVNGFCFFFGKKKIGSTEQLKRTTEVDTPN